MNKNLKRKLIVVISMILVMYMIGSSYVFAGKGTINDTITVPMNTDLMNQVLTEKPFRGERGSLSFSFSDDRSLLFASMIIDDNCKHAVLSGNCIEEQTEEYTALLGYYEGYSVSQSELTAIGNRNFDIEISADITIIDNDVFVIVTLYQSDLDTPILFFGARTDRIIELSKRHYQESLLSESRGNDVKESYSYRSPGATQYQGSSSITIGNRTLGEISAFHSSQLLNQGNMTVYEKINTNSTDVDAYVQTDLGYGYNYALSTVDQVVLSMRGNMSPLHAIANTYSPSAGSTSFNLIIPYYIGPYIGFGTISVPITTSSTTILTAGYPDSTHPNNYVEWTIYKAAGFGLVNLDGDGSTQTGISSSASYTYEDLVSTNTSRLMRFTGSLRFKYYIYNANDIIYAHFTTPTVEYYTAVTIIPHN